MLFLTDNDRRLLQDLGFVVGRAEDIVEGVVVLYQPIFHRPDGSRSGPIPMRVTDLKFDRSGYFDDEEHWHPNVVIDFFGMAWDGIVWPVSFGSHNEMYFLDESIGNFTKVGEILCAGEKVLEGAGF